MKYNGALLAVLLGLLAYQALGQACLTQGLQLLGNCQDETNFLTASFPLNSTTPITLEQRTMFIATIPANLPSQRCCCAAKTFISPPAACQCDASFLALVPKNVASAQGIAGLLSILGEKCGVPVGACA